MIEPSPLSLVAAALYLVVAWVLVHTSRKARVRTRPSNELRFWQIAAGFFLVLALVRVTSGEELLRMGLRTLLEAGAIYQSRQALQIPLAIAAMIGFALIGWKWMGAWRARKKRSGGEAILLAKAGIAAMLVLIILRSISLHEIDAWLYSGPRLNWWIDIGASLIVAASAWRYLQALKTM